MSGCYQSLYVEVLTASASESDLVGDKVLAEAIKLISISEDLIPYNWCPDEKGSLEADTHIGSTPCEDEGRDQGHASTPEEMAKINSRPPDAWEEA